MVHGYIIFTRVQAAAEETARVTNGMIDVLINNGAKTGGAYYFTRLTDL